MRIYLAGGFTLANQKGVRERKYAKKFPSWNRLFSFYHMDIIENSTSVMETSSLKGAFLSEPSARMELMQLIRS